MQQSPSLTDKIDFGWASKSPWTRGLDGLGEDDSSFWSDLAKALPAVAQSSAQIITALNAPQQIRGMTQAGMYPIGYNNGIPVYASTPAGVTPNNPYSLPSGYALPAGVTPTYPQYPIYQTPSNLNLNALFSQQNLPYIAIGGLALLILLAR